MPRELAWTNIARGDGSERTQNAWDMYVEAKAELEAAIAADAIASGNANNGDSFKYSYTRWAQGTIGIALDAPAKSQSSGFGGLKRPVDQREVEAEKLAEWRARQASQGRRY